MQPSGTLRKNGSQHNDGDTVRQTIVETIEAPRLKGVTTEHFVDFKLKRELYERRVAEKNTDTNVQMPLTTYKNSIDKPILQLFVLGDWVPAASVEEITEEQIKACVDERSRVEIGEYDLPRLERKIQAVVMRRPDENGNLETEVWNLLLKYNETLEKCGYAAFIQTKPQIAVEHIMKRIAHPELRLRMVNVIKLKKDEGFKKDFKKFIRELTQEARFIDRQHSLRRHSLADISDSDEDLLGSKGPASAKERGRRRFRGPRKHRNKQTDAFADVDSTKGPHGSSGAKRPAFPGGKASKLPNCLNPKCSGHHFVRDCPISTEEEKRQLKNAYHEEKRRRPQGSGQYANRHSSRLPTADARKHGALSHVKHTAGSSNTSLFSATFYDGAVEAYVLADQGADANVLPPSVFAQLRAANPRLEVRTTERRYTLGNARRDAAPLQASRVVEADCVLRLRHTPNLVLRGLKWLISDEETEYVYLARHVLASLGLDNQVLLAAASDRYNGVVDVPKELHEHGYEDSPLAQAGENLSLQSILQQRAWEYGSTFHCQGGTESDALDDSDVYVDLGEDPEELLDQALAVMLREARENGLSAGGHSRLSQILQRYKSVFRIRLGQSPPADVPPMRIRLQPDSRPIRVKARRYSADQRAFLDKYVDALGRMGFVTAMPTAQWQAAPLLVPKAGSKAKYRLAVDLRPVNAATVKEAWPMPHLESEVSDFAGSKCFAILDFVSGYWQLPLHPDCYTMCGIATPKGVVASKRVLPGLANATAHFQRTVEPLFASLRNNMKAWLDDFSLHAAEEDTLLDKLETFFAICSEKGLFLSARKCKLFSTELRWCGRIISGEGYRMDPANMSGLQDMAMPTTAEELSQFVHCCRWMCQSIPMFAELVAPLQQVLETAYAKSGRRTKRSIRNIALRNLSWGTRQETAFRDLQDSLRSATALAYPDQSKALCVFTDASQKYWSAVVTQTLPAQLNLPVVKQTHEPLAFLSSSFKKAEINWTTFEKEGFAIFQTFDKLDYMLLGHPNLRVFTDHRNLLFVFAPLAFEPALGRHVVSKVQRWALFMSRFQYAIEHVCGDENVFADILTRWVRGYRAGTREKATICSVLLQEAQQIIPAAYSFSWPDLEAIRIAQARSTRLKDKLQQDEQDGLWKFERKIWIPEDDLELKLKILAVSHCGTVGHRGITATSSVIRESFWWEDLDADVRELVKGCMHCIVTRSGEKIPRPLGQALHGSAPNEVVHMDYLYMGPSTTGMKYTLVIRDDLSSYVWIWPTAEATAEAAAEALCIWLGVFGSMKWLVSDQGAHFKNKLLEGLASETRARHHFTTAYSPWANGSVERICREVLRSCRALLSEWKLAVQDWPAVTEAVQSVINHAPLKRLGVRNQNEPGVYRTPLEVFTGHKPVRPLMRALPIGKFPEALTNNELCARQLLNIEELQTSLEGMHREVKERCSASRQRMIQRHNQRTNVHTPRFDCGDFVMVRHAATGGHKLSFHWKGPRRITGVRSSWVFEVENIRSGKREVVHARRLQMYRADMDGKEVSPVLLEASKHLEAQYETVASFEDIRSKKDGYEVRVKWLGLPDAMDKTWEPLQQVFEDLPGMLEDFLHSGGKRDLKRRALEQLSLSIYLYNALAASQSSGAV